MNDEWLRARGLRKVNGQWRRHRGWFRWPRRTVGTARPSAGRRAPPDRRPATIPAVPPRGRFRLDRLFERVGALPLVLRVPAYVLLFPAMLVAIFAALVGFRVALTVLYFVAISPLMALYIGGIWLLAPGVLAVIDALPRGVLRDLIGVPLLIGMTWVAFGGAVAILVGVWEVAKRARARWWPER